MGIVRRLTEKPWLAPGADPAGEPDAEGLPLPAAAVGLRIYFGVASVMFLLIAVTFVMRMDGHGLVTGQQPDWKPMLWPRLLWFNTAVLMLSSAAWEWARAGGARGQMDSLRTGLIAGGVLALVFLAGQLTVWRQLEDAGCGLTATTMSAFFYLITALHGLHVLGGLAVWGRTTAKVLAGSEVAEVRQSVDLCAIYWHFLLLVWLVMFTLFLVNRR
ncbi:MAG TPA: cytochrome c oxidase subunit 3 [Phenylobacterium sp.]|uniref:cytochrome c oxidase subunit 3 n=1 Tax=Phenylobacterium sp. TaxID=1871053 RepID=UPI002B487BA4|nr:cytochrome c oxidase subunit 3 [Phenylobacterium sp.]HKR89005.1 cytochrome c oxidase subunit 3 [Phenylobacterium sp.]